MSRRTFKGRPLRAGALLSTGGCEPAHLSAGERSYPASEVRGSSLECKAAKAQERSRGDIRCLRSGAAAERSYTASKVRDSGQKCQAVTVQEQPRGATPPLRPGAAARRSYPRL